MYNFYFSYNKNTYWFILFGIFIHLIASYFSIGYTNSDEHYQIIGPLEKLLKIETTLTWEFDSKIRPWLQPYFYFLIIKSISFLEIKNPFILIFILRIVSSLIGFLSIIFLYNHFKDKFNLNNNFSKILIFAFWFYAFIHARTSSENLSISMLIFGVVIFDNLFSIENKNKNFILAICSGLFFGLSMILKYQMIISVFFVYLWFLLNRFNFENLKYLVVSCLTIIFVLIFGLFIDYFGYGAINNTYYEYYYANFVKKWFEHFGDYPFWYYLKLILINFFPPISIILIISILIFSSKEYKNILTYISLPVVITLSTLSNKELRFLYPVLIFTPFYVSYVFSNTNIFFAKIILANTIIFFNFLFMLLLFIPATEEIKVYEYLFNNKQDKVNFYYYGDYPYKMDDLEPRIYTSFLPPLEEYKENSDLSKSMIIIRNRSFFEKIVKNNQCDKVFSVYPEIIDMNPNWRQREFNWYIVSCK